MTPAFEKLQQTLKQLPGVGYRSAERIALNLLVEKPARLPALVAALQEAAQAAFCFFISLFYRKLLRPCPSTRNSGDTMPASFRG